MKHISPRLLQRNAKSWPLFCTASHVTVLTTSWRVLLYALFCKSNKYNSHVPAKILRTILYYTYCVSYYEICVHTTIIDSDILLKKKYNNDPLNVCWNIWIKFVNFTENEQKNVNKCIIKICRGPMSKCLSSS